MMLGGTTRTHCAATGLIREANMGPVEIVVVLVVIIAIVALIRSLTRRRV